MEVDYGFCFFANVQTDFYWTGSWNILKKNATYGKNFGIEFLLDAETYDYGSYVGEEGFVISITHPKDNPIIAMGGFLLSTGSFS